MKRSRQHRSRSYPIRRIACCLAFAGLTGCHSAPPIVDAPEDYAHSYVEYPYNSDGQGNISPIVVGSFSVPAQHGAATAAARRFPLGYVRYLGSGGDPHAAVVILSDGSDGTLGHRQIHAAVRNSMDVVVLYRRGFGLSVPAVDCGFLEYPLARALVLAELREAASGYASRCAERWEAAGLAPRALMNKEVAQDLNDLARVTNKQSLYLVLERSMSAIGIEVARLYPDLIAGLIFIDPYLSEGASAEFYDSRLKKADKKIATLLPALTDRLMQEPVIVDTTTRSGTPISVAVGPLDLSFVASRAFDLDNGIEAFSTALVNASRNDYSALGTLVIEIRKQLNSPGNALLISSLHAQGETGTQLLQFALSWPDSAFAGRRAARNVGCKRTAVPQLVLTSGAVEVGQTAGSDVESCTFVHATVTGERNRYIEAISAFVTPDPDWSRPTATGKHE